MKVDDKMDDSTFHNTPTFSGGQSGHDSRIALGGYRLAAALAALLVLGCWVAWLAFPEPTLLVYPLLLSGIALVIVLRARMVAKRVRHLREDVAHGNKSSRPA